MEMKEENESLDDKAPNEDYINYLERCVDEADSAKRTRMELNRENYMMFQMRYDFTHKRMGQSKEVLAKVRMSVIQITSFFQQALVDLGEWWRCVPRNIEDAALLKIKPEEIQKLTNYMMEQDDYYNHVGNSIQSALLGALLITKPTGRLVSAPKFKVRKSGKGKDYTEIIEATKDKTWELKSNIVRQEDFFPDPSGKGLYCIERMWLDYHEVAALSVGPDAIYDHEMVEQLSRSSAVDSIELSKKANETVQDEENSTMRPKIEIHEFWGNIINDEGEITHENIVMTVANKRFLIRPPEPNPMWHRKNPYVLAPLLEVANSVWPIALMDAPTKHAHTLIEFYNLMLDAAFKSVHAPSQIRVDDLEDPSQIADGITPGTTLKVKSSLPPGAKVMESVDSGDVPSEAMNILNVIQQEFNSSSLTNDLRQGVMPFRAVKATEVVEASQTITSVFQGVAKNIEQKFLKAEVEKNWETVCQNWKQIDKEVFISLFGKGRGTELSQLSAQDVFVNTVNGLKFEVFGISQTLSKQQDFRKLTTLLQTVGTSEVLMEEFIKKYDFGKLLGEVMTALDIDKRKIEVPEKAQGGEAPAALPTEEGAVAGQGGPDLMSQVPQAGAGSLSDMFSTPQFPGSPATKGQ